MRFVSLLGVALAVGVASADGVATVAPVTVKITDTRTTLSRQTAAPGIVVLAVKNVGRKPHDFTIGQLRLRLLPRQSTTLRVPFLVTGDYTYRSTSRGVLHIVEPTPPAPKSAAVSLPSAPTSAVPLGGRGPCTSPSATTVWLTMTDAPVGGGFTFSPLPIPCGTVTLMLMNAGQNPHGLQLTDPDGNVVPSGPPVGSNQTATTTVTLSLVGLYQWRDSQAVGFTTSTGYIYVR